MEKRQPTPAVLVYVKILVLGDPLPIATRIHSFLSSTTIFMQKTCRWNGQRNNHATTPYRGFQSRYSKTMRSYM